MVGAMPSFWKILLGLALVLPVGAYVAGSLVASASDDPEPRNPLIIEQSGPVSESPNPSPAGPSDGTDDGTDDGPTTETTGVSQS